MSKEITESKISQCIEWGYQQALNGLPGTKSAEELANDYLSKNSDLSKAINSLIRWQTSKSALVGFATGLPGLITLPVTLPTDLISNLYLQIRLVATIAIMTGYDIKTDQVKTLIFACLIGDASFAALKEIGIKVGTKLAKKEIGKISGATLKKINAKIVPRLVTKNGSKGIIRLSKMVPIVGGVVGSAFDSAETLIIAKTAKKIFINA